MSFWAKLKKEIGLEMEIEKENNLEEKNNSQKEKITQREIKTWQPNEGKLMIDVYQTESEFCLETPIAGIELKDIEVFTQQGMLVIKGKREKLNAKKERKYFFQECYWGPFSRKILLPDNLEIKKMKVNLEKGILTIKIPKINPNSF